MLFCNIDRLENRHKLDECNSVMKVNHELPISAMIVGYNESHLLPGCFQSISFCDEIFYTDLGSTDDSLHIAKDFGAIIKHHEKVPNCETVQSEVVREVKNDWVIFIDPDESVDPKLAEEIITNFQNYKKDERLGAVMVPWIFYFKRHRLRGTVWGGINHKNFLVHKDRFVFEPIGHYGRKILPGFNTAHITYNGKDNVMHHYWMQSFSVFLKKHFRYLKNEGVDRYNLGVRQSIKLLPLKPFQAFALSFFKKKGYKDGFTGLFLSAFWAFYETYIALDLIKIQRRNK